MSPLQLVRVTAVNIDVVNGEPRVVASVNILNTDNTWCRVCNVKCTAGQGTSNLKKPLVRHQIYLKAEECTMFDV